MPIDNPDPLPQVVTDLANIAFQTLQGGCGNEAEFFKDLPFNRTTGKDPDGFGFDGLNDDSKDRYGADVYGYLASGFNFNGYERDGGDYEAQCEEIHKDPPEEPD